MRSAVRFKSSASNHAVTIRIQAGVVSYHGKSYTIMDCPGFFDNSSEILGADDGPNLCKLVKALEESGSIAAILYVYTDRFSTPQKIWFDRLNGLIPKESKGNIIVVHNKLNEVFNLEKKVEYKFEVNNLIKDGTQHSYAWFGWKAPDDQVQSLLSELESLPVFQLQGLTVPEICYEKEVEGPEYEEMIGTRIEDHGSVVTTVTDKSYFKTEERWNPNTITGMLGLTGWPGAKVNAVEPLFPKYVY